jgi:hypothetical protein
MSRMLHTVDPGAVYPYASDSGRPRTPSNTRLLRSGRSLPLHPQCEALGVEGEAAP